MNKKLKLIGKLSISAIIPAAALSGFGISAIVPSKSNNQQTSSTTNAKKVDQTNPKATQRESAWIVENVGTDAQSINRVVISAMNNAQLSNIYAYQLYEDNLFGAVKQILLNNINSLFSGPQMQNPNENQFVIWTDKNQMVINNREGWVDLYVEKIGYYNPTGEWNPNGVLGAYVRVKDFKFASPTPVELKIKTVNGLPYKADMYPFEFVNEASSLLSGNNQEAFFNYMSRFIENFDSSNFPFTDYKSNMQFNFDEKDAINNSLGLFNLKVSYTGIFADDEWCTYYPQSYTSSLTLQFAKKGITSFNNMVIDFRKSLVSELEPGTAIFGNITPADFVNNIINNDANSINWLREQFWKILVNPYIEENEELAKLNIVFSNTLTDYDFSYGEGSVILAGNLNNLFITNTELLSTLRFGKDTNYQIILTGLDQQADTKVIKSNNFPSVDLETNLPIRPSVVLEKLQACKGVSWSDNNNYAKLFFQVLNPPKDLSAFSIKTIEGSANDVTGELRITRLEFNNAMVNGIVQELVVRDLPFIYTFPTLPSTSTSISEQMYIDGSLANLYPYEFVDDESSILILKNLLIQNGIVNSPNVVDPTVRQIEPNDLIIEQVKNETNNFQGYITVNVYLKYYVDEYGHIQNTNKNNALKQTVKFNGFNFTNPTLVSRNINYDTEFTNIYPFQLNDDNFWNGATDYQKILKFFSIYKLPKTSYDENGSIKSDCLTNFSVSNINNLQGTADISFDIVNGYFEDNQYATFNPNPKTITLTFNFFKESVSTKFKNEINLSNVSEYTVSEFVKILQEDTTSTSPETRMLKNEIFKNGIVDVKGIPDNINATNAQDWIQLVDFDLNDQSDINKSFVLKFTVNSWFDEQGYLQPAANSATLTKEFSITINGDFKNVTNTRFRQATYNVKQPTVSANSWVENPELIKQFIIDNWSNYMMLEGDIPINFDMSSSLILKGIVACVNDAGWMTVNVSLKTYYQDNQLVQNNEEGYSETTIIELRGFASEEPTVIPNTQQNPVMVNYGNYLLSTLYDGYIDTTLKWNDNQWKEFVLYDVIGGSKKQITINDFEYFRINRIDDKRGLISFDFKLTKYWNENFGLVQQGEPGYIESDATGHNVFVGGFKTQNQTSFIANDPINLKFPSRVGEFYFDENNNEAFWQELMYNSVITQYDVYDVNSTNFNINMTKNSGIIFDNANGAIIFKDVSLKKYYDSTFSLPCSNGTFSINEIPENQINTSEYPYPENVSFTDNGYNSPTSDVTFDGFKKITEPTNFNESTNPYIYNQDSKFIIDEWSTTKIVVAIQADNSPEQEEFKRYIFDNVVTGTKDGITYNDISLNIISNSHEEGTITLTVTLNKYWGYQNQNISFISDSELQSQVFTIGGFCKITDTVITDGSWNATGNIATKKPSELLNILQSETNISFKSIIIQNIINQCISGNVKNGISRSDNINLILTDAIVNDIDGTLTIKFSLKEKWSDGWIVQDNTPHTFTINELSKIALTTVAETVNLNQFYFDPNTFQNFNVSDMSAEDFLNNGYESKDFNTLMNDLYESQYTRLIFNVYNNEKPNVTGFIGETSIDGNSINLSFTVNNASVLNATGTSSEMGSKNFTVTLTGFKEVATGPTKFITRSSLPVDGELAELVRGQSKITADEFSNEIIKENQTYVTVLKQFIWDNFVDKNSNIKNLSWESVQIVYNTSSGNAFEGKYTVTFYLKDYWNANNTFVQNQSYEQAKTDLMFKIITITNFPKIENATNDPTIPISAERIAISGVKIDPNNPDVVDDTLMHIPASQVRIPQNEKLFEAWIMQNLYTGNLKGLVNNSIADGDNVNITKIVIRQEDGEVDVTVELKNYYTQTGIAKDGCSKFITVYGFKKVNETTANDGPFNLTSDTIIPSGSSDFLAAKDLIKENRVSTFVKLTVENQRDKIIAEKYIKEWLVLNRNEVFNFLPENMTNEELRNAIEFNYSSANNLAWRAGRDNTLIVSINLLKYQNKNGDIIDATSGDANPLQLTIKFKGFLEVGIATGITDNADIWVSEQPNNPWFLAKQNGKYYYDLQASELFIGNRLDPSASETIKRMILAKPTTNESYGNYNGLIYGRTQDIDNSSNIRIDETKELNTLGIIQIKYTLLKAWTKDDIDIPTGELKGSLTLYGFKTVSVNAQVQKTIVPFVLAGIGGGVFLIFVIIGFIIFYRRRNDIEYQQ